MSSFPIFADDAASVAAWQDLIARATDVIAQNLPQRPYRGDDHETLAKLIGDDPLPSRGSAAEDVLELLAQIVARSVAVWHPHTVAHLHCPVLLPALAAEVAISALNPSLDSFDQAPAATMLESAMTRWLCQRAGFGDRAGATFTSGGTMSNFMGLLLARDTFSRSRWNHSCREHGLHPESSRMRILCSADAHFSLHKSAHQLGLGMSSIVPVKTDKSKRMSMDALEQTIAELDRQGSLPIAVVATAGTTDFGAIDPIADIAELARRHKIWLHVDAAYGGALLMSRRHRHRLDGLALADSIAIDFHKAFLQPVSCGAFLARESADFDFIRFESDYLNPSSRSEDAPPDLVDRSILTTRRFDALKLWMSLRMLGAENFAELVDRPLDLATRAAELIAAEPRLHLLIPPELGCIVFRYIGTANDDAVNEALPGYVLREGLAVLGHTKIDGAPCLKFTLLNPRTGLAEIESLLALILRYGAKLSEEIAGSSNRH